MRLVRCFDAKKVGATFVSALLGGSCAVGPSTAVAQEFTVVIARDVKNPKDNYIWVVSDCTKGKSLNLKADTQTIECTLTRQECEPGNCKFEYKSDDQPPYPVTIGISSHNPTCGWVWDPYRYKYIYKCW
jgi:hypothetical protein